MNRFVLATVDSNNMECSRCHTEFVPREHRVMNSPIADLFSFSLSRMGRGQRNLWRWSYVEDNFNKVSCPSCGAEERCDELKIFGVFSSKEGYRIFQLGVLVAFFVLMILFTM